MSVAEPAPDRGGATTYRGAVRWDYRPRRDRRADPGEVVWAWVAFEEDARVGKDRPIAVIGRTADVRLVAVMLSTKDHSGDGNWLALGSGPWDPAGRASWVRTDRLLAVHPDAIRREGAALGPEAFARLARAMRRPRGLRRAVRAVRSLLPPARER